MKKITGIIILALVILAAIFGIGVFKFKLAVNDKSIGLEIGGAATEKDATYRINGTSVTLKNGVSEVSVTPGSTSKVITRYFGNEIKRDLNSDGREDVAFILTQQTSGTGTFYYVVTALNTMNGWIGSDAVLLGDRIAPQTTELGKGNTILVNYAERLPSEPFTTKPSIGKSVWLLLDPKTMQLSVIPEK